MIFCVDSQRHPPPTRRPPDSVVASAFLSRGRGDPTRPHRFDYANVGKRWRDKFAMCLLMAKSDAIANTLRYVALLQTTLAVTLFGNQQTGTPPGRKRSKCCQEGAYQRALLKGRCSFGSRLRNALNDVVGEFVLARLLECLGGRDLATAGKLSLWSESLCSRDFLSASGWAAGGSYPRVSAKERHHAGPLRRRDNLRARHHPAPPGPELRVAHTHTHTHTHAYMYMYMYMYVYVYVYVYVCVCARNM